MYAINLNTTATESNKKIMFINKTKLGMTGSTAKKNFRAISGIFDEKS